MFSGRNKPESKPSLPSLCTFALVSVFSPCTTAILAWSHLKSGQTRSCKKVEKPLHPIRPTTFASIWRPPQGWCPNPPERVHGLPAPLTPLWTLQASSSYTPPVHTDSCSLETLPAPSENSGTGSDVGDFLILWGITHNGLVCWPRQLRTRG